MTLARLYMPHFIAGGLLLLYLSMVVLIYKYVVVGYGLYFSAGYQDGSAVIALLYVWVLCFFLFNVLGSYAVIDGAYKLFSLCFVVFICAPALLIGAISSLTLSPLFIFNMVLVSVVLVGLTRLKDFGLTMRFWLARYFMLFPFIVFSIFAFYLVFLYRGELSLVALDEVYTKRAQAKEFTGLFIGYAVGWVSNFASPVLIAFGLYDRKYLYVCFGVAGYLLIYMLAGHKSSLISMALIFGLFYFSRRLTLQKVLFVSLGGLITILLVDSLFGRPILAPYTFDRMIVAPSVLSLLYFDFFEGGEPIYLSHSILRGVFTNPYGMQPPEIIGAKYFDGDWANVNFVGEGFANFNSLGVLLYLFFTVFIVKAYDFVSCHLPVHVRLSIFVPVLLYLMNASPLTLILTGGLFPLVFVICLSSGRAGWEGGVCR